MLRPGKYAALGLAVVAAASVSQAARPAGARTAAPAAKAACTGDALAHELSDAGLSDARVRSGARAKEPMAPVTPRKAAEIERTLRKATAGGMLARAANDEWIDIPVWFHVIKNGRKGDVSKAALQKQLDVLDSTYRGKRGGAGVRVNFWLKGITRTENKGWFTNPRRYAPTFTKKLHKGGKGTLNFYTADLGNELLGWATWPWDYTKRPKEDGVIIHFGSMPGGKIANYNLGFTGAHETGHWLGLYHTFGRNYPDQDGCEAGDLVSDTPDELEPASGCPVVADTCAAPGTDPIHNYMDYAYDDCMTEFTEGQGIRIHNVWKQWRVYH
ncbi:zinc metalloprotease [Actinocorallia lasiicapitis]